MDTSGGYWFELCPRCGEYGRLLIVHDVQCDRFYLKCEEYQHGFPDPHRIASLADGFTTLQKPALTRPPSSLRLADIEAIDTNGWREFAKHFDPEAS